MIQSSGKVPIGGRAQEGVVSAAASSVLYKDAVTQTDDSVEIRVMKAVLDNREAMCLVQRKYPHVFNRLLDYQ